MRGSAGRGTSARGPRQMRRRPWRWTPAATAEEEEERGGGELPPPSKRVAVPSLEDPDKPAPFGRPSYDGVIAGKVSGRKWKQVRQQRSSAMRVTRRSKPLELRNKEKELKKAFQERVKELKEEIRQSKVEKRRKREEREKKKKRTSSAREPCSRRSPTPRLCRRSPSQNSGSTSRSSMTPCSTRARNSRITRLAPSRPNFLISRRHSPSGSADPGRLSILVRNSIPIDIFRSLICIWYAVDVP
ncbi:unnamed protein product [Spirodela intermedia]|uniref:Coiled-coil domain-containing protein 86 n=1 Tax=Spirodela intermedia TaxID=51605 RepID=A0A7I8IBU4_SPIIN|nr:unnamed protein product [Spirodela intermedia]CAA6655040.1 unnamed protein product [Spirodela intermedia]